MAMVQGISGKVSCDIYTHFPVVMQLPVMINSFPVISYNSFIVGMKPNLLLRCFPITYTYGFVSMMPYPPMIVIKISRRGGYSIYTARERMVISTVLYPTLRRRAMIAPTDVPTYLFTLLILS
jgi:hypothetical protein